METTEKKITSMLKKYPNRIPLIIKTQNTNIAQLKKSKYMVPNNMKIGNILHLIRTKIGLKSEEALFLFSNNTLLQTSLPINEAYKLYASKDKILYIDYNIENTFG